MTKVSFQLTVDALSIAVKLILLMLEQENVQFLKMTALFNISQKVA